MIRINLLPHRAEQRLARQNRYAMLAAGSVLLGGLVVGLVHLSISSKIEAQMQRNQYLQQQTAVLDAQIGSIHKLREQTKALLARKNVVEDLQSTRSDAAHVFDQMLRILPDGVYLKSLKQSGRQISLVGYTQSNARIPVLMRAIEASPWFDSPALGEIHLSNANGMTVGEFNLTFNLSLPARSGGTP